MALSHIEKAKGQSLAEIIVSLAIAFILVGSAAMLVSVALRANMSNKYLQASSFLAQDLMDKLAAFAEGKWYCPTASAQCFVPPGTGPNPTPANYGLANLDKIYLSSLNIYRLSTSTIPFVWVGPNAAEAIELDGVTYTRYFFVNEVCRDSNGAITTADSPPCSSTQKDLSTLLAVVTVQWQEQGQSKNLQLARYLTHGRNDQIFVQTDWSGGPGQGGPWINQSKFDTSNAIDHNSKGSIRIQSPAAQGDLTSSVFNTCSSGENCGAGINTIMWNGTLNGASNLVRFQIASSDLSTGPWSFTGYDGTSGTYYQPPPPTLPGTFGLPLDLKYDDHKNMRYVRYKIFLDAVGGNPSPVVDDVIINWSP